MEFKLLSASRSESDCMTAWIIHGVLVVVVVVALLRFCWVDFSGL